MDTELASRLLAAARAGDAALIRALVPCCGSPEEDGPPDAPGGITPLMAAAAAGHEAVVEVLLECGADAAKRDARGPPRRRPRPRRGPPVPRQAAGHRGGQGPDNPVTAAARQRASPGQGGSAKATIRPPRRRYTARLRAAQSNTSTHRSGARCSRKRACVNASGSAPNGHGLSRGASPGLRPSTKNLTSQATTCSSRFQRPSLRCGCGRNPVEAGRGRGAVREALRPRGQASGSRPLRRSSAATARVSSGVA